MKIFHQSRVLKQLDFILSSGKVHHSLFFQGPSSVGKMETALGLVRSDFCERRLNHPQKEVLFSCEDCYSCLRFKEFKHPGLFSLSCSDRLLKIKFLQKSLIEKRGSREKIVSEILFEINRLLDRQKKNYLNRLKKEKYSFKDGEVIKLNDLEKFFHQFYLKLDRAKKDDQWFLSEDFIKQTARVQNSLDRTIIPKENLKKIMLWSKSRAGHKKWIIIEDLSLIHPSVVGFLLKNLEEPDPDTRFILISDDINQMNREVMTPLLSRCLKFSFGSLEGGVEEVLQDRLDFSPEHQDHLYAGGMESYYRHFLEKTDRESSWGQAVQLLNQPIYQIVHLLNRDKNRIFEAVGQLKLHLELHLKEYNPSDETEHHLDRSDQARSKSERKWLKIRYSDCILLMQLIHDFEKAQKITHWNDKNLFFQLISFLKRRNIFSTCYGRK